MTSCQACAPPPRAATATRHHQACVCATTTRRQSQAHAPPRTRHRSCKRASLIKSLASRSMQNKLGLHRDVGYMFDAQ
jgi:hypothetical protein